MATILWHLEPSHYNEKVRWALDYKEIPHEKRAAMPGVHGAVAIWVTRSGHRYLPVLELDGKRIGDSTAIIAALEERFPEPALYPPEPAARAAALALEDYFDEHLAPDVRRFIFHHTLPSVEATTAALIPKASPARKRVLRLTAPAVRRFVRTDLKITEAEVERSVGRIWAGMDRIEAELDGGEYLVGDSFSVADLAASSLFTPLLAPPERPYLPASIPPAVAELRAELEARPGGEWVYEMYRRHRSGIAAAVA